MIAKEKAKIAKKSILGIIFSRRMLIVFLLLIQILFLFSSLTMLGEHATTVYLGSAVMSMLVVVYIINSKGTPEFKMSWILFVLLIPIVGTFFYLFVKIQPGTQHIGRRLVILSNETKAYMKQDKDIINSLRVSKPANANLAHYMANKVGFPVYGNTSIKYFSLGEDKFQEMIVQLEKAERFIFLEYFIVEEGYMWDTILEILARKVEENVEVRFMYDGMCSMSTLPFQYPKKMKKLGIQCKAFNPVRPILSTQQNNRDHRKICVIDGKIAFTGGINLADEYINKKVRFGHWKDTAVMLEGEAVQSFTMMFLQMWYINERRTDNYRKYLTPKGDYFRRELGYVMPYGDSPYDDEDVGLEVYLHILNHAKKYVHIMTPYLILDNKIVTALTYAAKCGIDVKIIMPHIPDKWYAFAVAKTYYGELINAGVQIYEYTPGFVHAKVFVSDDDTATVGTINLDYRSLYLHFECGVYIYNNPVVRDVEKDFRQTLKKCRKVTAREVHHRNFFERVTGRVLRLIAPLM